MLKMSDSWCILRMMNVQCLVNATANHTLLQEWWFIYLFIYYWKQGADPNDGRECL